MKRLTVYLDDYLNLALAQITKRRGQANAELIRETLAAFTERELQAGADAAMPSWVGAGESGGANPAEHDNEILLELLERDHEEVLRSYDEAQKKKAER